MCRPCGAALAYIGSLVSLLAAVGLDAFGPVAAWPPLLFSLVHAYTVAAFVVSLALFWLTVRLTRERRRAIRISVRVSYLVLVALAAAYFTLFFYVRLSLGPGHEARRARVDDPERLVQWLGLAPGAIVADIGAGRGFWTARLAPAVRPGGKIIATEIQPVLVTQMKERLRDLIPDTVEVWLTGTSVPAFGTGTLDAAFLYESVGPTSGLSEPARGLMYRSCLAYLKELRPSLRACGRLILADPCRDCILRVAEEAGGYRLERETTFGDKPVVLFVRADVPCAAP
jgi:SAM-dependent methyltransferase